MWQMRLHVECFWDYINIFQSLITLFAEAIIARIHEKHKRIFIKQHLVIWELIEISRHIYCCFSIVVSLNTNKPIYLCLLRLIYKFESWILQCSHSCFIITKNFDSLTVLCVNNSLFNCILLYCCMSCYYLVT